MFELFVDFNFSRELLYFLLFIRMVFNSYPLESILIVTFFCKKHTSKGSLSQLLH